jgi:hypothetical protein
VTLGRCSACGENRVRAARPSGLQSANDCPSFSGRISVPSGVMGHLRISTTLERGPLATQTLQPLFSSRLAEGLGRLVSTTRRPHIGRSACRNAAGLKRWANEREGDSPRPIRSRRSRSPENHRNRRMPSVNAGALIKRNPWDSFGNGLFLAGLSCLYHTARQSQFFTCGQISFRGHLSPRQ